MVGIGNFIIGEKVDRDGDIEIVSIHKESFVNKNEAKELIAHLVKVFGEDVKGENEND